MSTGDRVLARRVLTVAVILPLFLAALFRLPQSWWGVAMLLVVAAACLEWSGLVALGRAGRWGFVVAVLAGCLAAGLVASGANAWLILGAGLLFWLIVVPLWLRRVLAASRATLLAAGVIVLVTAWYALYLLQANAPRLLVLLGVVWMADTAAYFAGRRFGRRKLAPDISPGKTWEGVLGAVAGVGVYYGALWWAWAPDFLAGNRALDLVLVVGMLALSIEGDLFESWLKRRAGVKDSGTLLPGHGGVLDRIDGIVAALPLAGFLASIGWH